MDYSELGNKRRKRLQNPHTTRVRNKIGLLILRVTLALVLIAGFAGVGAGMGLWLGILNNAPVLDIDRLGPISPLALGGGGGNGISPDVQLTSFILCARTGEERERLHPGLNHTFAPLEDMPRHLLYAFVAIEDERFFEHNGIDPRGIVRALHVATIPDRAPEGASTITQQLIKNMLGLTHNDMITKLQEQYLAVQFERHLRDEFAALGYEDPQRAAKYFILESYLNIIYLGRQQEGVQAAAWFYYGICVSELSIAQAATIASITQHPSRFPPDIRPDANWVRTKRVLNSMLRLEFITEEEHAYAMRERHMLDPITGEPRYDDDGEPIMIGYVFDTIFRGDDGRTRQLSPDFDCFTAALLDQVRDDLMAQHGLNALQANNRIFSGGLTIYSTQNMEMQATVDRVFLDDSLWPGPDTGFTIELRYSMTVYNEFTGERRHYHETTIVRSVEEAEAFIEAFKERRLVPTDTLVEETVFKIPQPQGAFVLMDHHTGQVLALRGVRGEQEGNRLLNRATQSTRSPGSQMKPLVPFGPLIDMGIMQPSSIVDDIPFYLPNPGARGWEPGNHWGSTFRGLTTVREVIFNSGNVASARAAADPTIAHAGVPTMRRFLEQLGISTLHPNDGAAMVLGGLTNGLHLIELTGAYAAIANLGEFNRPVLYTMVLDHQGNILLDNRPQPQRVMRATTAYLLTHSMIDTVTRGTGGRANWTNTELRGRIPISGKTGTSQGNRDLGFVGFTPYFTGAFWIGNDDNSPMHQNTRNFHTPLWREIMEEIHQDLPARSFERPTGIVTAHVCLDSGHLPSPYCALDPRGSRIRNEVFAMGHVPTQVCRVHQQFTYCTESGMLACQHCPEHTVMTRVGLVRAQPIDHIEATVRDRAYEVPLAIRHGLVCTVHDAASAIPGSDGFFCWETFQWIPYVQEVLPPPIDWWDFLDVPVTDDDDDGVPPVTDIPWGGLGAPIVTDEQETGDSFVPGVGN